MIFKQSNHIKVLKAFRSLILSVICLAPLGGRVYAQGTAVASARIDARRIVVGDKARLFIEVQNNPSLNKLQWAIIPDTFNNLEAEKDKIDTIKNGDIVTYRQRLQITGFDSGVFVIPSFEFSVTPVNGAPYTIRTDSFPILVQTVAVDTTKPFKGIKGIIYVKGSWLDYIWYIVGGLVLLAILAGVIIYFATRKKPETKAQGPVESLQDRTLRLLGALDAKQLWQKKQVKEYYVELTDIVRGYIEQRFQTPAMELTTDELLTKSFALRELLPYHQLLSQILHTADLAKFAKFQPLPQEHLDAMARAKEFVDTSRPIVVQEPTLNNPTLNNPTTNNPTSNNLTDSNPTTNSTTTNNPTNNNPTTDKTT